jgi:hypothetical protein
LGNLYECSSVEFELAIYVHAPSGALD